MYYKFALVLYRETSGLMDRHTDNGCGCAVQALQDVCIFVLNIYEKMEDLFLICGEYIDECIYDCIYECID